ncbi:MAG: 3-methyl-2-oxobutanoate hydroxymethyltransferase [Actinomycetota bacterium]|jgi:3-methyl-2-oxobutanoate hydroxymethyltransferase|nr:3-methyl-2-oxobutanoate hydroxymethyltransferase [Actinomycetota bacterium]
MDAKVTLPALQSMKRDGRKIVAVVAWDFQIASIVDRAGVDIVSVGDTVGVNLWGQPNPLEVTMEQMIVVCQAVRRGVKRALLSCDFPFGPLQEGPDSAVRAAVRLVKEAGVDVVKLDGAADFLDAVTAIDRAGIPVFAQFGITPQRALRHGIEYDARKGASAQVPMEMKDELVAEAKRLEAAGASLLDFTNSGPVVGPEVAHAVSIPVLGGFGGGPWLDGRVRMAHAAIGYAASGLDDPPETYANVAQITFDAITAYADDVRSGRQIKGGIPLGDTPQDGAQEGQASCRPPSSTG